MNNYIGKVCPYCKTAFKEGDDIVVCSQCDMPHHKECWVENGGCTTFGCLGTISAADGLPSSVTATRLVYEDTPPANTSGDELARLVEKNNGYYMPCFWNMKMRNEKVSWNWAAFLGSHFWLIYRKMYSWGIISMLAMTFIAIVNFSVMLFLYFAECVVFGLFGNSIYLYSLEKKQAQIGSVYEPYKTRLIIENGGTNTDMTTVCVALFFVVIVLIYIVRVN